MDTTATVAMSRYLNVQFQGKAGSLIINSEKVIFRPDAPSPGTTKARSWRWAAIDRVEVLDPSRGSTYRSLKLKSKSVDSHKAVTITVPGEILNQLLKDMNQQLSRHEDALGIEGPVHVKTPLVHKEVPPPAVRAVKTTIPGRSSITTTKSTSLSPKKTPKESVTAAIKKPPQPPNQPRRASMPAMDSSTNNKPPVTWKLEVQAKKAPSEASVASSEDCNEKNSGLLNKVGQKILKPKYPLWKAPEKYRPEQPPKEEAEQPLLVEEKERKEPKTTPAAKKRGLLSFMKPPAPRRPIEETNMADMENKALEQQLAMEKQMEQQQKKKLEKSSDHSRKSATKTPKPTTTSPVQRDLVFTPPAQDKPQQQDKPKIMAAVQPAMVYVPPQSRSNEPPQDIVFTPTPCEAKEKVQRDIVFSPPPLKDDDVTSHTSASSAPESPPKPSHSTLWNPNAPEHKFRIMILHHAATCPCPGKCPYDPVCSEYRGLLNHMDTCQNDECCPVDKCHSTKHFLMSMRLMKNYEQQQGEGHRANTLTCATKDFLAGMGAVAPVPVIHIQGDDDMSDWDAFSAVSDSAWWELAGS